MLTPCSQCSTVLLIRCATSLYQTGAIGVQHRVGHVADRRLTKKREEACGGESTSRRTRSCVCPAEPTGSSYFPFCKGPRQILQCTVDHFESFDQCAEVLVGIAEHYAAGHLDPDGCAWNHRAVTRQEVCCQPDAELISTETEAQRQLHGHARLDDWSSDGRGRMVLSALIRLVRFRD